MKRIIILLLAVIAVAGTTQAAGKNKKVLFSVSMHCESCQKRIEKNISFEKGVKDMEVCLPKKTVEIAFDSTTTSVLQLQEKIQKLGYECTLISTSRITKK